MPVYAGSRSRLRFSLSFDHCRIYAHDVSRERMREKENAIRIGATRARARVVEDHRAHVTSTPGFVVDNDLRSLE